MFEELQSKIKLLEKNLKNSLNALNINEQRKKLKNLLDRQSDPELYNNIKKMTKLNKDISQLENKTHPWIELQSEIEDNKTLLELAQEESNTDYLQELENSLFSIQEKFEKLELVRLFNEDGDENNTYLTIHSGAGGTESCDWAEMLLRMYSRWIEKNQYKSSIMEIHPGEEAGIKSVTILVEGLYAHGNLKCETGIHRLVRLSPFDSAKRRHTSFCSVTATAEIDDSINIEINSADLRIDTYRASGAGGQHVNTTDSAVRITHLPTNTIVQCQAERSQIQNREKAIKMLRGKLYELEKEKRATELKNNKNQKKKIEWGSQIRSYVFHPYNMVKDHRTNHEVGNVNNVMDGAIDDFIFHFLKFAHSQKH